MTRRARDVLRIVIFSLLILFCIVNIGTKHIKKQKRRQELSEKYSYEIYSSYVVTREAYYVYVMCNPEYTLNDIMAQKFTDEFFVSLKSKIDDTEIPKVSAKIYFMIPSEELPYGWEKDELNISLNFDMSIFHRHTACIVTIPYGADSFDECNIEML